MMIKKIKKIFLTLFAILFIVLPLLGFSYTTNAALGTPTPAAGDGCLPDSGDQDCVDIGVPGSCPVIADSAGLVPCGRNYNDPATAWDECAACSPCTFILTGQLLIEFLTKIAGVVSILAIIIGGFLYMFSVGNSGTIEKAKSIIKYVLIGFLIVFIAWVIVNTILVSFGYIDPIDGVGPDKWHVVDC